MVKKLEKLEILIQILTIALNNINFQALHAQSLGFIHPTSGKELFFHHRIA